jgi:hypothetical protein
MMMLRLRCWMSGASTTAVCDPGPPRHGGRAHWSWVCVCRLRRVGAAAAAQCVVRDTTVLEHYQRNVDRDRGGQVRACCCHRMKWACTWAWCSCPWAVTFCIGAIECVLPGSAKCLMPTWIVVTSCCPCVWWATSPAVTTCPTWRVNWWMPPPRRTLQLASHARCLREWAGVSRYVCVRIAVVTCGWTRGLVLELLCVCGLCMWLLTALCCPDSSPGRVDDSA